MEGVGVLEGVLERDGVVEGVCVGLGVGLSETVGVGDGVLVAETLAPTAGADGVVEGVGDGVLVAETLAPAAGADGVVEGVLEGVADGVGVKRRLAESTIRMSAEREEEAPQSCWDAVGTDKSSTRTAKRAVDTGEDVVVVVGAPSGTTQLLPRLRRSVAATETVLLPAASVHETRRTCDSGTPVALAKEQRRSVMLASERKVLWAL
jgi:hypothetical protein